MFTGIIEEIGIVRSIRIAGSDATLEVQCAFRDYVLGESIAVNGCCLSVTRSGRDFFEADASTETLRKTTLGTLTSGSKVHLERALVATARLGGHIVSGHVDGVGTLVGKEPLGRAVRIEVEVPANLAPFLAPKGSVAIDGISLTVNEVEDRPDGSARFGINVIPHTWDATTLGRTSAGRRVNMEVDALARYVARILGKG